MTSVERRGVHRRHLLAGLGATSLIAVLGASANEGSNPHWNYDEESEEGPDHWGDLVINGTPAAACAVGERQSPIDLIESEIEFVDATDIAFNYQILESLTIEDNGHTIEIKVPAGNTITLEERDFELAQFHFHAPSEHTIAGSAVAMEMHMVHSHSDGKVVVLSLLIQEGEPNAAFADIFAQLPEHQHQPVEITGIAIDPLAFFPESSTTVRYDGSLTTPPCSEIVRWVIFAEPIQLGSDQIGVFTSLYSDNARPAQDIGDRTIVADEGD